MAVKAPRGTHDVLPSDSYKWRYVEETANKICSSAGYKEIRFPTFEETELFQRGVGDTTDVVQKEMYTFLDKLISVALPRVRDFRGINPNSFDGRGNYSMGVKEQLIFPEIEYDKVDKIRGMDIIFVTTAKTDEEAKELLTQFGMPFAG